MSDENKLKNILEAKVKALEELVAIQKQTIETLLARPAQIQYITQYVPHYIQQPYYGYGQVYYGAQSGGQFAAQGAGGLSGTVSSALQAGCNNAQASGGFQTTGYCEVIK